MDQLYEKAMLSAVIMKVDNTDEALPSGTTESPINLLMDHSLHQIAIEQGSRNPMAPIQSTVNELGIE